MFHWIHHLFNPHCDTCREERREDAKCSTCEVLQSQLEVVMRERRELLQMYAERLTPVEPDDAPLDMPAPIVSKIMPWAVRRQELEAADRVTAAELRKRTTEITSNPSNNSNIDITPNIDELEKELGIDHG